VGGWLVGFGWFLLGGFWAFWGLAIWFVGWWVGLVLFMVSVWG